MRPTSTNENYILAIITLGCIALFSLAVRSSALSCGADGFTAFALLVLTASITSALYFALVSALAEFLDKWLRPQKEQIVGGGIKQEATPPLEPNSYERHREVAQLAKAQEEQTKLDAVISYTQRTLAPYMNDCELTKLCSQITLFLLSDWTEEKGQAIKISPQLKSIDLMHLGWNISQPFQKPRKEIATFLKHTFAHTLRDVEVSTLQRKLTNTEGKYLIPLCKDLVIDEHSTPSKSYSQVT